MWDCLVPTGTLLAGLHIYQGESLQTVVDVLHGVIVSGVSPPSRLEVGGVMRSPHSLPGALTCLANYQPHLRLSGGI